jgi:hypothetical protein
VMRLPGAVRPARPSADDRTAMGSAIAAPAPRPLLKNSRRESFLTLRKTPGFIGNIPLNLRVPGGDSPGQSFGPA